MKNFCVYCYQPHPECICPLPKEEWYQGVLPTIEYEKIVEIIYALAEKYSISGINIGYDSMLKIEECLSFAINIAKIPEEHFFLSNRRRILKNFREDISIKWPEIEVIESPYQKYREHVKLCIDLSSRVFRGVHVSTRTGIL
jgi:hypothetical protein